MKKLHLALAAGVAALGMAAVPAVAKDVTYTPAYYAPASTTPVVYEEDDIVIVPYGIREGRDGTVTLSRAVSIKDIDLRYDAGVDELNRRISWTAREICDELDDASRSSLLLTSERDCVRDAVRGARPQIDAAVQRARYY